MMLMIQYMPIARSISLLGDRREGKITLSGEVLALNLHYLPMEGLILPGVIMKV